MLGGAGGGFLRKVEGEFSSVEHEGVVTRGREIVMAGLCGDKGNARVRAMAAAAAVRRG